MKEKDLIGKEIEKSTQSPAYKMDAQRYTESVIVKKVLTFKSVDRIVIEGEHRNLDFDFIDWFNQFLENDGHFSIEYNNKYIEFKLVQLCWNRLTSQTL